MILTFFRLRKFDTKMLSLDLTSHFWHKNPVLRHSSNNKGATTTVLAKSNFSSIFIPQISSSQILFNFFNFQSTNIFFSNSTLSAHTHVQKRHICPSVRPMTLYMVASLIYWFNEATERREIHFLVPASNHFIFWCRSCDERTTLMMDNDYKT